MSAFKVTDVRVGRRIDTGVTVFIDGLGTGERLIGIDPLRAGLMLSIFASRRDCYWDDATRSFVTTPVAWMSGDSPINKGRVTSWEMRIPEAAGHQPEFFMTLLSDAETRPTSGNAATGWARIQAPEREMPLLLALVASRYCYYSAKRVTEHGNPNGHQLDGRLRSPMALLETLRIVHPIIQAPMGGGPGTPELAAAVSNAGGLGFLAGGYLTPDQIRQEIARFRELSDRPFGVNLFAGGYHERTERDPSPILALLSEIHRQLELPPPEMPKVPPDPFLVQLAVIVEARPRAFSFTFGIPDEDAMRRLRTAGIVTLGTATTMEEGLLLERAGVDAVIAQGAEAGAHRGTFTTEAENAMVPTMELVRQMTPLKVPVIASGGMMSGDQIHAALRAGAEAVQMGTAFLACDEAGTSKPYRASLLRAGEGQTAITRAFSGRAARGLRNGFIDRVGERDELILPYPIQNSLTRPMRAAAAARGISDYLSLWAGTGVAQIRPMAAAELIATLMQELNGLSAG